MFGLPLSVGTESECEFIDLRIDKDITPAEVKERLNRHLTPEMQVLEAYEPTAGFGDVVWAKYELRLKLESADADLAQRLQALYQTPPLYMTKKTKSGEKEIDITTMIKQIKVIHSEAHPDEIAISAILAAGNTLHLNPEMLITAAKDRLGILSGDPTKESYSLLRTHVYLADGATEFK